MRKREASEVATVILAGGQGTRLHPLTIHHSKPAVSYGGRYRLIDIPISNSINSDFRQIFVITQYLSGELEHHISQTYHFDVFNPGCVDVLTPQENEDGKKEWFEGTADAVRKNLSTILKSSADYFLILSGDQLYNINFQALVEFAKEQKADLTIAALPVLEKEARRMGLLKIDGKSQVTDFAEKPKEESILKRFILPDAFLKNSPSSPLRKGAASSLPPLTDSSLASSCPFKEGKIKPHKDPCFLGSMGIYVFKRKALVSLLKEDPREDFGHHLITTAVKNWKTFAYVYHGYWEDIGTVASYYEANLILTKSSEGLNTYDERNPIYTRPTFLPGPKIKCTKITDSIICEGSIIEAEEITHSVIGLRSHIRKGTVIRNTVMMGNHFYMAPTHRKKAPQKSYGIGENCFIEKAIIDEHVHIGNNVKLLNKERLEKYDSKGIFIRDGIIIVTAGTHLPDGFEL